jgi:myosin-5
VVANAAPGLQTPRLKRLAEIVSQQAIAQQEKMDFDHEDGGVDGANGMNGMNGNGNGIHENGTIHEEVAA